MERSLAEKREQNVAWLAKIRNVNTGYRVVTSASGPARGLMRSRDAEGGTGFGASTLRVGPVASQPCAAPRLSGPPRRPIRRDREGAGTQLPTGRARACSEATVIGADD